MNVRTHPKPLRILKFGGTSIADARCIENVVEIVRAAWRESDLAVVVSAMSGVTNKLAEAATHSETGDRESVITIFNELLCQHEVAVRALIHSAVDASCLSDNIQQIVAKGYGLCETAMCEGALTPQARDSILSLGERISARLVAAALAQRGLRSEAIDATELVVTDSHHGCAEPLMEGTRERCQRRLRPPLLQGIVPVVTGFVGATLEGVVTTLGRGGSDYSATILGASLDANEVIIWSDVDGMLTADPRLVLDACAISELSYDEATELAYFGAKVLHPKALRPVIQSGIPVWIRNTFAPDQLGTRITSRRSPTVSAVKAVTTRKDVASITLSKTEINVGKFSDFILMTAAATGVDVLLMPDSSSPNEIRFVVSRSATERLQNGFARVLTEENLTHISVDCNVALVTMVGENLHSRTGVAERARAALKQAGVNTLARCEISSEHRLSIVVEERDAKAALIAIHREFQLGFEAGPRLSSREFSDQLRNG